VRDDVPHAAAVFVVRDARYFGIRRIVFDGKTVPRDGNVKGPFRIKPGRHVLTLERQVFVTEPESMGYILTLIALLCGASQYGPISGGTSTSGYYSNRVDKVELDAKVGTFYLVDCCWGGYVTQYESWTDLESEVIKRFGPSGSEKPLE
jgi:hypothetical protein